MTILWEFGEKHRRQVSAHWTSVRLNDTEMQVAGNAYVKRACMAAENVGVGAGHSKMLASS